MKNKLIILIIVICLFFIGIGKTFYSNRNFNIEFMPTYTSTISQEKFKNHTFKETASQEMRNNLLENNLIDTIINEELIKEKGELFFVFTGIRNSIIGMSEYKEKVKIWVDKSDGVVVKTEIVAQEEKKCQSDADCIVGGLNGEICTLKDVLPELELSVQSDELSKCYNLTFQPDELPKCCSLTKCKCVDSHCRWESNEKFDECIKKIDIRSLPVPFLSVP